jgi:hypothetical protein
VHTHGPTLGLPLGVHLLGLLWSWIVTKRLFSVVDLSQLTIESVS